MINVINANTYFAPNHWNIADFKAKVSESSNGNIVSFTSSLQSIRRRNHLFVISPTVEYVTFAITKEVIFSSLFILFEPLLANCMVDWLGVSSWKDFLEV